MVIILIKKISVSEFTILFYVNKVFFYIFNVEVKNSSFRSKLNVLIVRNCVFMLKKTKEDTKISLKKIFSVVY